MERWDFVSEIECSIFKEMQVIGLMSIAKQKIAD